MVAEGAGSIARGDAPYGARRTPVLSLLFESRTRPQAAAIMRLAVESGLFSVSDVPDAGDRLAGPTWLELLVNGLTFDLQRLAPAPPRALPGFMHLFDLPAGFATRGLEAITLEPAPHLAGGENLPPVVRSLMVIGVRLAGLPGIVAAGWEPARSLSSPAHFRNCVTRWLEGGVFPGLGLTALARDSDGGLRSEGLAFFTGQELAIAPELARDGAAAVRLALRLIHELVETGPVAAPEHITGPGEERLLIEPGEGGRIVRIRRS